MKRIVMLSSLLVMVWTTPVFSTAAECSEDMKEIDQALAKGPKVSAADLEKIKKYRAEGEKLCKAGKHKDGVDTLEKAKLTLGI